MYILGISGYYHDSSAALIKDGKVVAAAEEERFTRKKHDTDFPKNAAEYCLKSQKISIKDVSYIAFYEKPLLKFERLLYQHLQNFPLSYRIFLRNLPSWANQKLRILSKIKKDLKYKGDVFFVEHHLAHAASAFFASPFRTSAIVTLDGVGEWTTTSYGEGNGDKISLKKEIRFPHSLGLLYSTITAYLGFSVNNSEYKVMGLAPYGDMDRSSNKFYKKLKQVLDLKEDGSYCLDMRYFVYDYSGKMPSNKLCDLLGGPISKRDSEMTQRHKDIAAALQMITEDIIYRILNHAYSETKNPNLVLAGGVALNSVANGKILSNTPFKQLWIQPNSSDGGTSIGAALFTYHSILKYKKRYEMDTAYLGPEFTNKEIGNFLNGEKIKYKKFNNRSSLIREVAEMVYKNKVVGWFQGRMEWGPRALGSRSILANPCNEKAKELLNEKVKHREKFRPFAPVVCKDDAKTYFECDFPIPFPTDYMLMVYPIRKKWHEKIPSVTHVDGSGRLQTVERKQNALYYDLIKEFGKLSGIPILINTSFNIRGEPIVCTPYDAYKCMMGTGIDCLIMGDFLIRREDNLEDEWDSEKYAKD